MREYVNTGSRLTVRQEAFCRAYVLHSNGTRAVREANYTPTHADVQASQILKRPAIQERIAQLRLPMRIEQQATRDRVVQELSRVAFQDPRELFDESGRLLPINELKDHVAACVAEVTEETRTEGRGEDAVSIKTKKVKSWDKMKALEMLAKHLQLYSDAPSIVVPVQVNVHELQDLTGHERELLRQLAESRAGEPEGDDTPA